ncbi:hypothetical protein PV08_09236 [Exophiala spinifera]|uniref:Uncharacterized protein n=1 Tax=Exophiala spinifera TaxID=91928 RepID=A0A0D1ZG64_9EURO|nr:uncharacterized protein PV08_09236 [Exophiala spinifera]KIW11962.1 hypothetical protein PV08_09236 [Exophiala spinifera]
MGFWPFGGRKNARDTRPHLQRPHTFGAKEEKDLTVRSGSESAEERGNMARNQNARSPDDRPRRLSKQRLPKNVSRGQTAPVSGPASETWNGRRSSAIEPRAHQGQEGYSQDPTSPLSVGSEEFTALPQAPTLLARRGTYDPTLTRRKSSKRKAEDYAREREIRAMSSPEYRLKRPASYSGSGPLRRDTQNIPGDFNRRLQRPNSKVSLPLPEVIQDAEDFENQGSFKVGILAALTPRPTLTYVSNPRSSTGKQPARLKPSVQEAIEEEAPSSRKRIDELADDLDAGALRELMDRDRRRHERKKAADRERLQRKLQRKADRQREEELRGRPIAASSTGSADLGTEAEEQRGRRLRDRSAGSLEMDGTAAPRIDQERPVNPFKEDPLRGNDFSSSQKRPPNRIRNPFEDEKEVDIMQDPSTQDEDEGSVVPVRSPLRTISPLKTQVNQQPLQAATISPPTSPVHQPSDLHSLSQTSGLTRKITPDVLEQEPTLRRASDQSSQQQQISSWTNFFKRGTRRKPSAAKRGRSTPSEFSNTSRESFVRKQQPPPVVVPRTFRKSNSTGVPQRTMSRFREDLPEFPISPPDSRVQSPEAITSAQAIGGQHTVPPSHSGTQDAMSLATTSSNPAMEVQQLQSGERDASAAPVSGVVLSQSLASVDSEGSWLSGKPAKRMSGGVSHPLRQSVSSITPNAVPGSFETEEEELAHDEYYNRLTPAPAARRDSGGSVGRRASSNIIDLERERQHSPIPDVPPVPAVRGGDETWHAGLGRQATVVRQASRAKSREGLLKDYGAESSDGSRRPSLDGDDEASDGEMLEALIPGTELAGAPILRARSVEYKGHARQISAGSAKLLNIRRASSVSQASTAQRSPGLAPKKTMLENRSQSPPRQP